MHETPDLIAGGISFVVFLYSTTLHEAAHAWSAWKLGDDTAYRGGQVSLDPTPHVVREPIGMVVVPILSFLWNGWMMGWASAPYDPEWARRHPTRDAWMSLAGPAANLLLVLLAALGIRAGIAAGIFVAPESADWTHVAAAANDTGLHGFLAMLLSVMFSLNLLLCFFNLLPVPPLDGSALPLLFLRGRAIGAYQDFLAQPWLRFMGLVVAWNVFGTIYGPVRILALNLLYPGAGYG